MKLRIVAGEWRGRSLVFPRGVKMRPTTEAVREALFSGLGAETAAARFADLFAGTGAVGLEALSRGAAQAVFLEENRRCVEAIRTNAANLRAGERTVIVSGPVEKRWPLAAAEHGPFDLVFADPPYEYEGWERLLKMLVAERMGLAERGLVVVEYARRRPPPAEFAAWKEKTFGETGLRFYRPGRAAPPPPRHMSIPRILGSEPGAEGKTDD